MTLEPGTRVGPYEILAPLAATTGESYKASDTRDGRTVALRMLPPHYSQHPEIKERLEQEIRVIASLNHPNISAAHEIVHAAPSADFLVTELLEDETLADRLARGRLSIEDALRIAIAVAGALDKAHRQGIVHRGLTPSVVVLTAKGPKIVDFALAKPKEEMPTGLSGSIATRTSVAPLAGVPWPAASYMAPERFDGAVADARADVFALGAMLHEMVTGRKAFDGRTPALVVAAVQSIDPDPVSATQPMAPPALDHVLGRCLAKDPRQRLQTAWDLLGQLQWIAEGGSQVGIPAPIAAHRQKRERIVWAVLAGAALVAVAIAVPAAVRLFSASPEPEVARYLVTGVGQQPTVPITISPDGRWIAGSKGGAPSRGMDAMLRNSVATQVLISDEVVFQPFWSADSRSIGFFADGRLKKADVAGGPAQTICETPVPVGYGTWNRDGVILFSGGAVIQRVLAAGGQPSAITTLDNSRQETEHLAPEILPDGRRYVFLALSSREGESAIYAGSLDSTDRTRLFASESRAIYASGHLLFNRGSAVFAQPFDAGTLALKGEAIRVADGVGLLATGGNVSPSATRFANFAASETGVLIYRSAAGAIGGTTGTDEQRTLVWIDRRGARGGQVGPPARTRASTSRATAPGSLSIVTTGPAATAGCSTSRRAGRSG